MSRLDSPVALRQSLTSDAAVERVLKWRPVRFNRGIIKFRTVKLGRVAKIGVRHICLNLPNFFDFQSLFPREGIVNKPLWRWSGKIESGSWLRPAWKNRRRWRSSGAEGTTHGVARRLPWYRQFPRRFFSSSNVQPGRSGFVYSHSTGWNFIYRSRSMRFGLTLPPPLPQLLLQMTDRLRCR